MCEVFVMVIIHSPIRTVWSICMFFSLSRFRDILFWHSHYSSMYFVYWTVSDSYCRPLDTPDNGFLEQNRSLNGIANYTCKGGYKLVVNDSFINESSYSLNCLSDNLTDGFWDQEAPVCERMIYTYTVTSLKWSYLIQNCVLIVLLLLTYFWNATTCTFRFISIVIPLLFITNNDAEYNSGVAHRIIIHSVLLHALFIKSHSGMMGEFTIFRFFHNLPV